MSSIQEVELPSSIGYLKEDLKMNSQDKNWFNLFGKYTPEGTTWHAFTTVYSPDLEVIRFYKFTRKFSTNPDKTVVYHHNTYYLPDGTVKEQSWEIDKQKCNLPDGVFHPEAETMRAISFGNGTSIWVSQQISNDKNSGCEVFFQQQDWRYSIIPVYQEGKLERIVTIQENSKSFPEEIDETVLNVNDISGNWKLSRTIMTTDLQESWQEKDRQEINISAFNEENKNYYLPGKILLSLPDKITSGQNLVMVIGKQIQEKLYQQIVTQYDETGKLINLLSEVYI